MTNSIANIIKIQLTTGYQNINRVMSWAAHNWQNGDLYLQFDVNGHHLTGSVRITYNEGADTYTVTFKHENEAEVYKKVTDVYFDEMNELIDKEVEYIEGYSF